MSGLNEVFDTAGRKATESIMRFDRALAARLGVSYTDYQCLDELLARGPTQAGELARATGFTTGAITGIVDRLVARGLVERRADPVDARRVVVVPCRNEAAKRLSPLVADAGAKLEALHASYPERDRELLLGYLTRLAEVMGGAADDLERAPPGSR